MAPCKGIKWIENGLPGGIGRVVIAPVGGGAGIEGSSCEGARCSGTTKACGAGVEGREFGGWRSCCTWAHQRSWNGGSHAVTEDLGKMGSCYCDDQGNKLAMLSLRESIIR